MCFLRNNPHIYAQRYTTKTFFQSTSLKIHELPSQESVSWKVNFFFISRNNKTAITLVNAESLDKRLCNGKTPNNITLNTTLNLTFILLSWDYTFYYIPSMGKQISLKNLSFANDFHVYYAQYNLPFHFLQNGKFRKFTSCSILFGDGRSNDRININNSYWN